jgi:hypothetical protein
MDLAASTDHCQMAVTVADVSLRARDVGGQPLAVLDRYKAILAARPDCDGQPNLAEIEPPVRTAGAPDTGESDREDRA